MAKRKSTKQKLKDKLLWRAELQAMVMLKQFASASLFARSRLEEVGAVLDGVHAKSQQTLSYRPADLSVGKDELFREHLQKNSSQFITKLIESNNSFTAFSNHFKKIFPELPVDKATEVVFKQIAVFAEAWSRLDIAGERRFANVGQMSQEERLNLAKDIANQNRALATLGGMTSGAGFVGLIVDSLWLLMVSLRTVYQLAMVYGHPLSGDAGRKTVYSIIASSHLNKMQDKQTLLLGLATAQTFVTTVDDGDSSHQSLTVHKIRQALKEEKKHHTINEYLEQMDKFFAILPANLLMSSLVLSNLNVSWLKKGLPLTAGVTAMYYNRLLIEEVIGVAQATLAPEVKLATVSDRSDNAEC